LLDDAQLGGGTLFKFMASLDFRNTNTIWASVIVETLARCGLQTAIVCPGSRSTPLTIALAHHPDIEAIPVLDERSAAFFALGLALKTGRATAIVCTSGTAGANFFPAVIEAYESRVPLLVLTADRPPELRQCNSGQAIDQLRLFGNYPNWQTELTVPQRDRDLLRYLRQTIVQAWHGCHAPTAGAVHLNCPFRDPLPPLPEGDRHHPEPDTTTFANFFENFFDRLEPFPPRSSLSGNSAPFGNLDPQPITTAIAQWQTHDLGLIIAGVATSTDPDRYTDQVLTLAKVLGWPVLAEGLSPVRNAVVDPDRSPVISTYDLLLRHDRHRQDLAPTAVIQLGALPTSKVLRQWLSDRDPQRWIVEPSDRNLDPLHGRTHRLYCTITEITAQLAIVPNSPPHQTQTPSTYLATWQHRDRHTRAAIDRLLQSPVATTLQTPSPESPQPLIEPQIAWFLAQTLPPQTPLFIANSMPIRDVEYFWPPNDRRIQPWFNRGANGIDGTLSSAIGIAHRNRPTVMLTGDLALLHDTNGFLAARSLIGSLTIVLIDNNGGGIFEMLPVAQFDPPFEDFFATPQTVNFDQLCAAYGVEYDVIDSLAALQTQIETLPISGVQLLHIRTDRKHDAQWRKHHLAQLGAPTEILS
jgi:2-succinyl-5-enolpyruvyl-6-hydroxy-3-cyclohexene-1-carboxylate synthase